MLDWLDALIARTCATPPALVGYALGGAIAARYAARPGASLRRLVLVDALGLAAFAPEPEFGLALGEFAARPGAGTHDALWRQCALDLDGLREGMGEQWEPFAAYNVDRARTPHVQAALGGLMEQFGLPAIPPAELDRIAVPTTLDLGAPRPRHPAGGRRGRERPPRVAPADHRRRRRRSPGRAARGLPARAARRPGRAAGAGFAGAIVAPGEPRYDELRAVFNGMIDRRPALIARCADAHDVATAVGFARASGLPAVGLWRRPQRDRQRGLRRRRRRSTCGR